jgi:hypothetical protein
VSNNQKALFCTQAVLFFTGSSTGETYDVELQICPIRFVLYFIWKMWNKNYIGRPERMFLLKLLALYMDGCTYYPDLHALCDFMFPDYMNTNKLKIFMRNIQGGTYHGYKSKEAYIHASSIDQQLMPSTSMEHDKSFDDYENAVWDTKLLSPDGREKKLETLLHRLCDHRIIFEVDEDGKKVQYGADAVDYYTVVMKSDHENIFFNGSNAIEFQTTDDRLSGYRVLVNSDETPIRYVARKSNHQ